VPDRFSQATLAAFARHLQRVVRTSIVTTQRTPPR